MTSRAEELAQEYADASATWHVENLYGGSKSYTEECCKDKAAIGVDLFTELRRLAAEVESLKLAEEGAKEAFGHVVQSKRDLEKELKKCEANLHSAHEIIRNQAKAKFMEVKHG